VVARIVSSPSFPCYGAAELKRLARPNLARGTLAGSALWIGLFLVLRVTLGLWHGTPPEPRMMRDYPTHVLVPPPPIEARITPQVARSSAPPTKVPAVFVPVKREDVLPEAPPANASGGEKSGQVGVSSSPERDSQVGDVPPEYLPPPDTWVYFEKDPVPMLMPPPEYPALAKDVGEEGLVIVRVLVGRDGRVRDAFVDPRHSILMLDVEALKAARRWIFEPALASGHPVAVWVSIPFRFSIRR